jgi:hypothetical protein
MREAALGHVAELEAKHLVELTSPEDRFRVAERFARQGVRDAAARLYRSVFPRGLDSEIGVRAAIACATLDLREGRWREAEAELRAALDSPFCTQELAEKIRRSGNSPVRACRPRVVADRGPLSRNADQVPAARSATGLSVSFSDCVTRRSGWRFHRDAEHHFVARSFGLPRPSR